MFENQDWINYSQIDDIHFCKKRFLYKKDGQSVKPTENHKTSGIVKVERHEPIQDETFISLRKNVEFKIMDMLPNIRSITSILAIEVYV